MKCKQCEESLPGFIRNQQSHELPSELSQAEVLLLEEHLEDCEGCQAALQIHQQMWELLGKEQQPSAQLKEKFMLNVMPESSEETGLKNLATKALTRIFQILWPSKPAGALAYSLVLLFSGILSGQQLPTEYQVFSSGGTLSETATLQATSPFDYSAIPEDSLLQLCSVQRNSIEIL